MSCWSNLNNILCLVGCQLVINQKFYEYKMPPTVFMRPVLNEDSGLHLLLARLSIENYVNVTSNLYIDKKQVMLLWHKAVLRKHYFLTEYIWKNKL